MSLKVVVQDFLTRVLHELSFHPFVAPYIGASRQNPPQHYVHQCEVIGKVALRKPIRILLADEIGLGKTVTAIGIAKYLQKLGRAKKVLIIVPRILVGQWHKELIRMGVAGIRHIERNTIESLKKQNFPDGYYIASMDLVKKEEIMDEIVNVPWDLTIIDEAHKFGHKTKRFWKIGKMLVEACPKRDVLFLSATPHRGKPDDYIARLQLLDPYLVKGWRSLDIRKFYEATHGALLYRRTKEDINNVYEGWEVFRKAWFYACIVKAREDEANFVERLVRFLRNKLVEFAYEKTLISKKIIPLLTVLIFKRASSSPYAAMTTLERLLMRRAAPGSTKKLKELIDNVRSFLEVGYEDYEYSEKDPEEVFNEFLDLTSPLLTPRDREEIKELHDMAKEIMNKGDSKLEALISLLEGVMADEGSKVIVFTEYKDTADYLIENIKSRHQDWASSILRLTSEEIRDEANFQKIKRDFEANPKKRILIATDVVAEGVNLQVANILVNYEIPWSLIKVEQRIGRVWRIGQKKEVEAYTFFMDNVADRAALNSMYRKLIALGEARLRPRPITGQDVLLCAEAEELAKLRPYETISTHGKRKKFLKVTEEKAILTFLKERSKGLERLADSIIATRQEVERELTSKGVLYRPKTRQEVESAMEMLGYRTPTILIEALKSLAVESSKILGFKVYEEEDAVRVIVERQMPRPLKTLDDIYGLLYKKDIQSEAEPLNLAVYGEREEENIIFPVEIRDSKSGATLYRELIGLQIKSGKILRGHVLLSFISKAIANCLGTSEEKECREILREIPLEKLAEIKEVVKQDASKLLEPLSNYTRSLESLRLRNTDTERSWTGIADIKIELLSDKPIACIRAVAKPLTPPEPVPEEVKKEIEEKAVEVVLEEERKEGRIPERVPETEHYDVRSIHPSTGEIRLIEVKGHKKCEVYAELTDDEAKLAERESDKYWLYIVYDIGSGNPKLLRFRDPLRTMNLETFEKVERRYRLWPKHMG